MFGVFLIYNIFFSCTDINFKNVKYWVLNFKSVFSQEKKNIFVVAQKKKSGVHVGVPWGLWGKKGGGGLFVSLFPN